MRGILIGLMAAMVLAACGGEDASDLKGETSSAGGGETLQETRVTAENAPNPAETAKSSGKKGDPTPYAAQLKTIEVVISDLESMRTDLDTKYKAYFSEFANIKATDMDASGVVSMPASLDKKTIESFQDLLDNTTFWEASSDGYIGRLNEAMTDSVRQAKTYNESAKMIADFFPKKIMSEADAAELVDAHRKIESRGRVLSSSLKQAANYARSAQRSFLRDDIRELKEMGRVTESHLKSQMIEIDEFKNRRIKRNETRVYMASARSYLCNYIKADQDEDFPVDAGSDEAKANLTRGQRKAVERYSKANAAFFDDISELCLLARDGELDADTMTGGLTEVLAHIDVMERSVNEVFDR